MNDVMSPGPVSHTEKPLKWLLEREIASVPMMHRFLEVNARDEPLRYEANIAISEGIISEGENMWEKKILEEGWEKIDV